LQFILQKYKHKQQTKEKENDVLTSTTLHEHDNNEQHEHVQQSNVSITSSSLSSDSSESSSHSPSDIGSEYESIAHADHIKVFPSDHAIKQQQRIPAHLSASDEELHLFLRNPPDPPIPFYPSIISFKMEEKHRKKDTNERGKSKQYFAAPQNAEKEVTVTYLNEKTKLKKQVKKKKKLQSIAKEEDVNDNLSLSISDENHLKFIKKECEQITMDPSKSMAAINDATKTSLLENVDVAVSQTLNSNENNLMDDEDEDLMHGNFANLSIDD